MIFKISFILINLIIIVTLIGAHRGQSDPHEDFLRPDIGHIKEDVKDQYHIELDDKTSEQELDWYYFQMHDFDKNNVLDGLEILTAMNHVIDEDYLRSKEETTTTPPPNTNDEEVDPMEYFHIRERYRNQLRWNSKFESDAQTIDKLFKDYDKDDDGFISYTEYIIARKDIEGNK